MVEVQPSKVCLPRQLYKTINRSIGNTKRAVFCINMRHKQPKVNPERVTGQHPGSLQAGYYKTSPLILGFQGMRKSCRASGVLH